MSRSSHTLRGLPGGLASALVLLACPAGAAEAAAPARSLADLATELDRLWVLVAAALVFFMQAGFLCFEVGSVRRKNAASVALKNAIDWGVCSLAFFGVGFAVMFGHTAHGVIGTDLFALDGLDRLEGVPLTWTFFMFQLAFAGTAVTIVSGSLAGRTGFVPYLVSAFFTSLVVYPVFGHWAWGGAFLPGSDGWLARLGFMDFAGSTVVHSLGAWVALAGAWYVGPRIGRYRRDGSVREWPPYSVPWSALGVVILWVGWWGFNGGSLLGISERVGAIIANTNLAASAAGLSAFAHGWWFQGKVRLSAKFLGGVLGGLVAITAGCNVVDPLGAVAIGAVAGVVHNVSYEWILVRLRVDDPVGAIAVHGCCGVWGTLAVALFGAPELLAHGRAVQLGVQALGAATCAVWACASGLAIFKLVHVTVGLRVSPEEELAGVDITGEAVPPARDDDPLDEDELRRMLA